MITKVSTKAGTVMSISVQEYAFVYKTEVKTRRTNGRLEHLFSVTTVKHKAYTIEALVADAVAMSLTSAKRKQEMNVIDRVKRNAVARDINFSMLLSSDFNKLYNVNI